MLEEGSEAEKYDDPWHIDGFDQAGIENSYIISNEFVLMAVKLLGWLDARRKWPRDSTGDTDIALAASNQIDTIANIKTVGKIFPFVFSPSIFTA